MTLQNRLEIIERLEFGDNVKQISKDFNINSSTVRRIRARKEKTLECAKSLVENHACGRKKVMNIIEISPRDSAFYQWMTQRHLLGQPVTGVIFKVKALFFHKLMKRPEKLTVSNELLYYKKN